MRYMSKICYEFIDSRCEITETSFDGGDITFSFPKETSGYLCLGKKKYRLTSGEVKLPISVIEDGLHQPRLIISNAELTLPPLEKHDKLITLPEEEGSAHRLSLRIARISCRVHELDKKLAELENYVRGSTCF